MSKPIRVCAMPGKAYVHSHGEWHSRTNDRTVCGTLVRVTSLKFGDVRMQQEVVVMRAKKTEFAVPVKRVRIGYGR